MTKSHIARTAAFLAALTGAVTAHAVPPNLEGSDTLNDIIVSMINNCTGMNPAQIVYTSGGSSVGGTALVNQLAPQPATGGPFEQIASPQSRALTSLQPSDPNYHCTAVGGSCTAIDNTECGRAFAKQPGTLSTAEGLPVGLDGLVVVTNSANSQSCGGGHAARGAAPNPVPPYSDMKLNGNWKTTLRVLFTGYDPATNTNGRCKASDNPTRAALADDYSQLFEGGCTAPSGCTGIAHAFRRADRSGTTDTFLALIGAPSINLTTGAPFCNGANGDDRDPIRRTCDAQEQVCEADGTLGLVLPISTPTVTNVGAELYGPAMPTFSGTAGSAPIAKLRPALGTSCPTAPNPTTDPTGSKVSPCSGNIVFNLPAGCVFPNSLRCDCRFPLPSDFAAATVAATGAPCLVGGQPLLANPEFNWNRRAGGCPAVVDGGSPPVWNFLNGDNGTLENSPSTWGTRGVRTLAGSPAWRPALPTAQRCCTVRCPTGSTPTTAFIREDVRVMNLAWRNNTNGRIRDFEVATGTAFRPAFYRIYSNTYGLSSIAKANPSTPVCQENTETNQIGCITREKTCHVGFAGREATELRNAEPLALGDGPVAIDPTLDSVRAVVLDPPNKYPMARKIYYNSLIGFSSPLFDTGTAFQIQQGNLRECIESGDPALAAAVTGAGFVPYPVAITREPACP